MKLLAFEPHKEKYCMSMHSDDELSKAEEKGSKNRQRKQDKKNILRSITNPETGEHISIDEIFLTKPLLFQSCTAEDL